MKPRRLLQLTSAVVFLDTMMFAAITPLLPSYVNQFGLTKTQVGVLTASYPFGTLVAALPAIWMARRFGVKLTVFGGLILLAGSSLLLTVVSSAAALDLSRVAQGFSGSLSWGGGLGWLVGEAPAEKRGETIGLALAAALAGAMFGPAIGGAAVQLSPALVFGFVGLLTLGLALIVLTIPSPSRQTIPKIGQIPTAFRDSRVRAGLWIILLFGMCYGGVETLAPLQLDAAGLGGTGIALAFVASVAIETVLAPILGRVSDRRGPLAPLRFCLPVAVAVLLAFGWPRSVVPLVALVILMAVSVGPLWTPGTALFSAGAVEAGVDHVVSFSLSNVAWSLGALLGAYLSGALAEQWFDTVPYSLLATICAATLVWIRGIPAPVPAPAP